MSADEIVKALKCCSRVDAQCNGCDGCPFEYCGPECDLLCKNAATLIESMQAQLAESQRGEKAAVEDLNGLARFEKERCAYCLYDEECEPGEMLCSYKGDKAFEWRGPQKAGEGGQDGN